MFSTVELHHSDRAGSVLRVKPQNNTMRRNSSIVFIVCQFFIDLFFFCQDQGFDKRTDF